MRVPWRRRRNLAERLRPYVRPLPPSEPMVSADPIRMFLYRWMIQTGDPMELISAGFDLDVRVVRQLLGRESLTLTQREDEELRAKIGLGRTMTAEALVRGEPGNLRGSQNRLADER